MSALLTADGRRAAALILLAGGGVAMTVYAGFVLWLVSERARYAFYLGVGALLLVAIVLTGFAGLLVKRSIKASGFGTSFEATDNSSAADGADAVAGAAVSAAAQIKGEDA